MQYNINQPYKYMQKHSEKIFSHFAFNNKS